MEFNGVKLSRVTTYFSAMLCLFLLSFVVGWSSKSTNNVFYGLIALPGLFFLLKGHGLKVLKEPLAWLWLVFMLWFAVSATVFGAMEFYKPIVYVLSFVFIVASLVSPDFFRSKEFIRAQFWILILYIYLSAIYSWSTGQFPFGSRVALLPARLINVIYASIWLFCALALALPYWVKTKRWIEATAAVLLSVIAVTFVLQTRTALVGAAFLFGLWVLYGLYLRPKVVGSILLVGALVLGLVVWGVHNEAWYISLWNRGDSYRVEIFNVMVGEWRNCGWTLGCGVEFHTAQLLDGFMPIQHPHNIFVALGVYTGAPALLLFVVLMLTSLLAAWRLRDAWGMFLACALVMLNFDGSILVHSPDELWPLVLMPAALILGRVSQARQLQRG
ncbi:O-antigen ligase domain-containing protein [Pseudomonas sp. TH05]|uniref:O-antigen ligase domain-containing protein n=1 Tax=unclassified Pseudomonas TaxID=196821 RepID=UPI0019136B40|nr:MULTISPECIES: O-antigen ligase domain-containing protein [unclassified Pseudomonas]MBK5538657.1 O-antigen ligase domain-containing protein [Pseudomonas sp. TH07]MBK5557292.1 O-antigen ligase domain-containing protein [Pseudomonas sp. TH05]